MIKLCIDIVDSVQDGITNTDHARLEIGDVGADCDAEICRTHLLILARVASLK